LGQPEALQRLVLLEGALAPGGDAEELGVEAEAGNELDAERQAVGGQAAW